MDLFNKISRHSMGKGAWSFWNTVHSCTYGIDSLPDPAYCKINHFVLYPSTISSEALSFGVFGPLKDLL